MQDKLIPANPSPSCISHCFNNLQTVIIQKGLTISSSSAATHEWLHSLSGSPYNRKFMSTTSESSLSTIYSSWGTSPDTLVLHPVFRTDCACVCWFYPWQEAHSLNASTWAFGDERKSYKSSLFQKCIFNGLHFIGFRWTLLFTDTS